MSLKNVTNSFNIKDLFKFHLFNALLKSPYILKDLLINQKSLLNHVKK